MSLIELFKHVLLHALFATSVAFLGAEAFFQLQGYRLSWGYWVGMLFVYGLVVVPTVLRRLPRAKRPIRGNDER